jgi:hypothetical protein
MQSSTNPLEDRIAATLSDLWKAQTIAPLFLEFIAVALSHDDGTLARQLYRATLDGMQYNEDRVFQGSGSCFLQQLFRFAHARLVNALDGEPNRQIWGTDMDRATVDFIRVRLEDRHLTPVEWMPSEAEDNPDNYPDFESFVAAHPPAPGLFLMSMTPSGFYADSSTGAIPTAQSKPQKKAARTRPRKVTDINERREASR